MSVRLQKGASPSATTVEIGNLSLLFSYSTIVAFHTAQTGWVASENQWGTTTGKHILQETGVKPADRLPRDEFVYRLNVLLMARGLG